jgi:hypothetical protein
MAVEVEWLEPFTIGLLLTMVVLCGYLLRNGKWHEYETGRATWGKWRIADGKGREWNVFMFGALKVVAPSCAA